MAILISGLFQAIYGNLQLLDFYSSWHSGFKISGSFFNPAPYAGYLSCVWTISLGFYLYRNEIWSIYIQDVSQPYNLRLKAIKLLFYYVPILSMIAIIVVLPATNSRAAWLGSILGTIISFTWKNNWIEAVKGRRSIEKVIISIIVSTVIIFGLIGLYNLKKESADGRILIWKTTMQIIKKNSYFGVGFDRFKAHYMNEQADYFFQGNNNKEALVADNSEYAFNEALHFSKHIIWKVRIRIVTIFTHFSLAYHQTFIPTCVKIG